MKWQYVLTFLFAFKAIEAYECDQEFKDCETTLIVEHFLTMRHPVEQAVYPMGGKIYKYDVAEPSSAQPIPLNEVITADGWETPRLVVVANVSLPGPPLIFYSGQKVQINVVNKLLSESISIHWHGLPQQDNSMNDGVGHVTQCPILPGQNFTYTFTAEPSGTFWYHSHTLNQRTMGLYGALIVREKEQPTYDEHIIVLQEWNHDWDRQVDFFQYLYGIYENRQNMSTVYKLDGDSFGEYKFHAGLINGKGRYKNNGAPLSAFSVVKGKTYTFRIISAATILPFRLSIDGHNITVVSSDGYDIKPITAESVIIQAGERYNIRVHANKDIANYWIRARTLEAGFDHQAEAILRYVGAQDTDPITTRRKCTTEERCLVVNCAFPDYPKSYYTDCIWAVDFRSVSNTKPQNSISITTNFREFFLNFAFPGTKWLPATINGKFLRLPHNSGFDNTVFDCSKSNCGEERLCNCTHVLNVEYGDVIQFVLTNMGLGYGGTHPVHIHGYSFYVLKMGYGVHNTTTGKYIGQNTDIRCNKMNKMSSFCNNPQWANENWRNGKVPGLNFDRPPVKDSIIIPVGGYVVVRIHASNPGLWLLHCHVDLHELHGQALVLDVSAPNQRNYFPVCGNRRKIPANVRALHAQGQIYGPGVQHLMEDTVNRVVFIIVTVILVVIVLVELAVIIYLCLTYCKAKPAKPTDLKMN